MKTFHANLCDRLLATGASNPNSELPSACCTPSAWDDVENGAYQSLAQLNQEIDSKSDVLSGNFDPVVPVRHTFIQVKTPVSPVLTHSVSEGNIDAVLRPLRSKESTVCVTPIE